MKKYKLAEYIKELRTSRAWSQAQLADIASVNIRTIQRLENSGRCSYETLLAVAAAFDMDVQKLMSYYNHSNLFENISTNNGRIFSLFNRSVNVKWLTSQKMFWLSFTLIFPAFFFITASIAKYNLGIDFLFEPWQWILSKKEILPLFNSISPLIFLGGLSLAVFLNLGELFSISFFKKEDKFKGTIIFNPKKLNMMIAAISTFLLLILTTYVFVENFVLR